MIGFKHSVLFLLNFDSNLCWPASLKKYQYFLCGLDEFHADLV